MSDDEVAASDVPPRYFFLLHPLLSYRYVVFVAVAVGDVVVVVVVVVVVAVVVVVIVSCFDGDIGAVDVLLLRSVSCAAGAIRVASPILGRVPEPAKDAVIADQVSRQLNGEAPFSFPLLRHGVLSGGCWEVFSVNAKNVHFLETFISNLSELILHGSTNLKFEPSSVIGCQVNLDLDFLSFAVSFGDDAVGEFTTSFVQQRSLDWVTAHPAFSSVVLLIRMSTAHTRIVIPIRGIRESKSESRSSAGWIDESAMSVTSARRHPRQRHQQRHM